jgi:catechol-2,3-dioxygenase
MIRTGQWTLDVHDVPRMATFWSQVMGFEVDAGNDGCATLWAAGQEPAVTIWLQRVDEAKQTKNRCHPDLVVDGDVDAEVERLLALGATRADVGQTGAEGFVVLADPEGNEFCLLRSDPRRRR